MNWSRLDGTNWSVKSLNLKETLLPFNATRILVSQFCISLISAGLTYGDPILRTGNPLSVELGPGKLQLFTDHRNSRNYFRRNLETSQGYS
jgi:hypothetical protein